MIEKLIEKFNDYLTKRGYKPIANINLRYISTFEKSLDVEKRLKQLEGIRPLLTDGVWYRVDTKSPPIPNLKTITGHFSDTPENIKFAMGYRRMQVIIGYDVVMYCIDCTDISRSTEVFIDDKELGLPTIASFI